MSVSKDERETSLVFEEATGKWLVYSSIPKHIRRIKKLEEFELHRETKDDIAGTLNEKNISIKKITKRILTDEQKEAIGIRLQNSKSIL